MLERIHEQILQIKTSVNYQLACKSSWGLNFTINPQELWSAASLIKLGIAIYGQTLSVKDSTLLTEKIELKTSDIVAGAGTMQFLSPRCYVIGDLLRLMISQSDNTATNALLTTWNLKQVKNWLEENYQDVILNRRMMDSNATMDNLLSAQSAVQLLESCFETTSDYGQLIRQSLHGQQNNSKLVWPVSNGEFGMITSYNKTGELPGYEHDAARFSLESDWLDCVVMTNFTDAKRSQALKFIRQVGTIMCQELLDHRKKL